MSLRSKYNDTKTFVKKYQTPIACTATAVMTYKLTSEYYLKISKQFAYEMGIFSGIREARMVSFYKFLETQNLLDEFEKFNLPLEALGELTDK